MPCVGGESGWLILAPGTEAESTVPVPERLFVGRECAGIDESRRILIDDSEVSRSHFEIRLDPEQDSAFVIDTSTNGTRVNGARVERAVPVPIKAGDRITVGSMDLDFRSQAYRGATADARQTQMRISLSKMVMVVGDITNYSTITQITDSNVVAESLPPVWWRIPVLILNAAQNGILEESLVLGYLIRRLDQLGWSPWRAIVFSAVLRGSYHLYQGFGGFVGNAAMGVIFGVLYKRWGRVTPMIIAHTLIDAVAFVGYATLHGHVSWLP